MIIKAYDKYQKCNVEIEFNYWEDEVELNNWASSSYWTKWTIPISFHSPDREDYEIKRFSDLEKLTI